MSMMENRSKWQWLLLAAGCFVAGLAQADYENWKGVNITGVRSVFSADKPESVVRSKVYFSKGGTRIEHGEGAEKSVSIINYQQQKCWLLQPNKKTYYEVAFNPGAKQCDKLDIDGFKPEVEGLGVFAPRPCFGFKGIQLMGEEQLVGRRATRWQCVGDPGGATVQHWFDFSAHMVVREVWNDRVTEGTQIELSRQIDHARLQPSPDYILQKNGPGM